VSFFGNILILKGIKHTEVLVENLTFKNLQIFSPDLPFIISTLPEIKIRNLKIEDSNFSIFV